MRKLWLVLLLLLTPVAYAAKCSEEDVSITTVEGIGTVYSSSDSSDGLEARFIDACFERSGWTLRAPLLIVREDPAGALVSADNAKIESVGANGTVKHNAAQHIAHRQRFTAALLGQHHQSGIRDPFAVCAEIRDVPMPHQIDAPTSGLIKWQVHETPTG